MTLAEFLASMEAQYGRDDRGVNVPMSERQRLLDMIQSELGGGTFQATDPNLVLDDNYDFSREIQNNAVRDPATGQVLYTVNPRGLETANFRDPETGQITSMRGLLGEDGQITGWEQFTPRFDGGANIRRNALLALGSVAGIGALGNAGVLGSEISGGGLADGTIVGGGGAAGGGSSGQGFFGGIGGAGGAGLSAGGAGLAAGGAAAGGATTLGSLLGNPAVVGGALSLAGGAVGSSAARDAAEAQQRSADEAIAEVRRQYDQSRADQMPWMDAGRTSLAELMGQMPSLNREFTQADFQNDPGYQFELSEGRRALDAAARARGGFNSSGSLRELMRYSQGLASTRFQDAWNRDLTQRQNTFNQLSGVAGTGQTTAGNIAALGQNRANTVGDLLTQSGNAQAAGRVGSANSWINAGSQALNNWQQQALINRLGSNLYR